jgi:hypothetical protein
LIKSEYDPQKNYIPYIQNRKNAIVGDSNQGMGIAKAMSATQEYPMGSDF